MGGRYRYLLEHSIAGEDLEPLRSGLEDAFIHLMDNSTDNFAT